MELTIYDIIKGPVVSEKAYKLNKIQKKLVLKVHPEANKVMVKNALERLFNVKVEKVNCLNREGKMRMVRRTQIERSSTKIAFITLAKGYFRLIFLSKQIRKRLLSQKRQKLWQSKRR